MNMTPENGQNTLERRAKLADTIRDCLKEWGLKIVDIDGVEDPDCYIDLASQIEDIQCRKGRKTKGGK